LNCDGIFKLQSFNLGLQDFNFLGCFNFFSFKVFLDDCNLFFFSNNLLFKSRCFPGISLSDFLFLLMNLSSFSTRFFNLSLELSKFSFMLSLKFLFDSSYSLVSGNFLLGLEHFVLLRLFLFLFMSPNSFSRIRLSSSSDSCF
jgi:hypothetical protein